MAFTQPQERPLERHMLAPCNAACPIGNDVEGFVALVQQEKWDDALQLLMRTNPLPAVTGRVCRGSCERVCNRGRFDASISIKALERAIADYAAQNPPEVSVVRARHKERIAVIGSGPAGLSCAYFLIRQGFNVTVFEQSPRIGGILRYGIPAYRLPPDILDREIVRLYKLGIDFKLNRKYGDSLTAKNLEDFDAVCLAIGLQKKMEVIQEEMGAQMQGERISGSEITLAADTVINAMGETGALETVPSELETGDGKIVADRWGQTSMPKIFAGGDIVSGRRSVARAIGSGRRAARAIAAYLRGKSSPARISKQPVVSAAQMNFDYFDAVPALSLPRIPVETAISSFGEIFQTPSPDASISETGRCLHCGVMPEFHPEYCLGCANCSSRCPSHAITIKELETPYEVKVEVENTLMEEACRICLRAGFHPDSKVCVCTGTRAMEVAAAILKGAKTPEDISRTTGMRTGCTSLCIASILCLIKAAGFEPDISRQPGAWYPAVATIWDIPKRVIDEFQDRGFRFEEDKIFYEKIGRRPSN